MANYRDDEFGDVPDGAQAESTACASNAGTLSGKGVKFKRRDDSLSSMDFQYLLAERDLPGTTTNPVIWLSQIALPIVYVFAIVTFGSADWPWFFLFVAILMVLHALIRSNRTAADQRAALLIPDVDAQWTQALIAALNLTDSRVRRIAQLRLTTLLPTLGTKSERPISELHLAQLFDNLTPGQARRDADFVIAIMNFASSRGMTQAIDGMEALAEMRAFSHGQRRVRHAARGYLPVYEERMVVAQEQGGEASIRQGRNDKDVGQADRSMSPQAQAWLDEIEREANRAPGMRFGYLLASWMVIVPYFAYMAMSQFVDRAYLNALLFGLLAILFTQLYRLTLTPQQAKLGEKLASVDDVEAVGALVEMTSWPDERIKAQAYSALIRVLPRLRSNDTHLLSAKQRTMLYQELQLTNAKEHSEYLIAILTALEQVGDTAAIPYVTALKDTQPYTIKQRRVVAAAVDCLPFLESCARQNRDSQLLLRATTSSDSEESLLRPVTAASTSDPELLVRIPSIQE